METKDFIIRKQNPLTEGMTAEEVEMFQLLLSKITANMAKMIKGEKE